MYYLLMLGRGHHAVDIPAELQSDLFYDSLVQKGSPQGALSRSNFSLLPDTEFKDECARLSAIDTSDWIRCIKGTRLGHPDLLWLRYSRPRDESHYTLSEDEIAETMAAHRCHFKRHEPDYYIWDSFLDELDDSPSSSITNTPASVPHHSHDKVHPVAHTPPLPPSDIYLRELQAVLPDLENGSNQEQRNIAPMAFFEAHRRMGKGNSGTVYRLRNTQILCKAISTSEGRCGYYRRHHFLCEVNVYSRLRGLQGKAIPKFYGAYETPDKKKGLIFLEDCGRCLSWLWWSDMHPVERHKIFVIAKKVAEAGVLSDSFNPRNVCWTMERGYRMIDFGRARFTSNPKSIQAWISMAAVELEVWPEEKLTSDE